MDQDMTWRARQARAGLFFDKAGAPFRSNQTKDLSEDGSTGEPMKGRGRTVTHVRILPGNKAPAPLCFVSFTRSRILSCRALQYSQRSSQRTGLSFEGPGHGPRRVGARCGPQQVPDAGRGPGGRSYVFWTRSGPDAGRLHHRRRRGGASTARDDSGRRARHEQAPDNSGEAVIDRSHVIRPSPEGSRQ